MRNQTVVYLDDFEMMLDLVIRSTYDRHDRQMDDVRIFVRADAGEVDATNIFSESMMQEFTEMLFDELSGGFDE